MTNITKILLGVALVIAFGFGMYFLGSQKRVQPSLAPAPEAIVVNTVYQHVHSVFKMPDGTILLGAHTGLFKSTDNGKTFARAKITSTDSSIDPDGEFMN